MVARIGVIALWIAVQQPLPGMPLAPRPDGRPTGLLVGQVLDAVSARPVPNAIVSLSGLRASGTGPGAGPSTSVPRVLTGSDGRFVILY